MIGFVIHIFDKVAISTFRRKVQKNLGNIFSNVSYLLKISSFDEFFVFESCILIKHKYSSWIITFCISRYSAGSQLVWFKAEKPEDCKTAPEEVNKDDLPSDMCDEVGLLRRS